MKIHIYDAVILGAGISGLATAHFLKKENPQMSVAVLEKKTRPGGAIRTHKEQGFMAEWGPHGFLDNVAESRELLEDFAGKLRIQKAPLKSFVRYVCRNGKLALIPQSPPKIIKSSILPLTAKLRVAGDLIKKPLGGEPTIAEWAAYRFGKALLPFVDAVATGTFAGDMEKLAIDHVMPALRKFEFEFGSVLKGVMKQAKSKPSGGLPSMVSFEGGIQELTDCLSAKYEPFLGNGAESIKRGKNEWEINTPKGTFYARSLVVAMGVNQSLAFLTPLKTPPVASIPEGRIVNVVMGFDQAAEIPFGFGYLSPRVEKRFLLGSLFSTHMFPGRAPQNKSMLESLVGGRLYPERVEMKDAELVEQAYDDLADLIHLPTKPVYTKVIRPEIGIPQLEKGHQKVQDYRKAIENDNPGLLVTGFGWNAIGMNDMIKDAKKIAQRILYGGLTEEELKAKGIYF